MFSKRRLDLASNAEKLACVLGGVLKAVRVERGLTQYQLATASGVDRAFIGHIETGSKRPSIVTLYRLAPALEMTPAEILDRLEQELQRTYPEIGSECLEAAEPRPTDY